MRRPKWWNENVAQFLLAVSLAVMAGLYRDGFPALFPFMREEFGVSRAVLGMYVSVLYLISSVIAVMAGHVADRLGAKRALTWGALALGIIILVHTWAPSFAMMLALAVLAAFGFSIISPGTNKVATDRFPPQRRGTFMGLVFLGWSMGGLIGAVTLPSIASAFGWRIAVLSMALAMLAVLLAFRIKYREVGEEPAREDEETAREAEPSLKDTSFRGGFASLLADRYILMICSVGLVLGGISGTMAAHYTLFFHLDLGYSEAIAGLGFAFLHAGSLSGRPAWGLLNDRVFDSNERTSFLWITFTTAATVTALALVSRFLTAPSLVLLFALTFVVGFCARGWPGVLFAAVSKRVDSNRAGMATGFTLLFVRMGITVAPPIFGYVADLTGTYEMSWFLTAALSALAGILLYTLGSRISGDRNVEDTG